MRNLRLWDGELNLNKCEKYNIRVVLWYDEIKPEETSVKQHTLKSLYNH